MSRALNTQLSRFVAYLIVLAVLVGGAFYGGRVYQNSADQSIIQQYNPTPQAPRTGGNRFSFVPGSTNNQTSAAIDAVGTPPPLTPGASEATPASGSSSGASGSTPTSGSNSGAAAPGNGSSPASPGGSGGSATTGGGGASGAATGTDTTGTLASITSTSLTLQSFQGTSVSVQLTAATHFYQASTASTSALAVGDRVAIGLDRTDTTGSTASSVTISPAGAPYATVRSFGGGFGGGGSGAGAGGAGGGYGGGAAGGTARSGAGAAGAGGFRRAAPPTGAITAVTATSITVQTATGSRTYTLASTLAVYQLTSVKSTLLKTGSMTAVSEVTQGGAATAVAQSTSSSGIVSFAS